MKQFGNGRKNSVRCAVSLTTDSGSDPVLGNHDGDAGQVWDQFAKDAGLY